MYRYCCFSSGASAVARLGFCPFPCVCVRWGGIEQALMGSIVVLIDNVLMMDTFLWVPDWMAFCNENERWSERSFFVWGVLILQSSTTCG